MISINHFYNKKTFIIHFNKSCFHSAETEVCLLYNKVTCRTDSHFCVSKLSEPEGGKETIVLNLNLKSK